MLTLRHHGLSESHTALKCVLVVDQVLLLFVLPRKLNHALDIESVDLADPLGQNEGARRLPRHNQRTELGVVDVLV